MSDNYELDLGPSHSWYRSNAEETSADAIIGLNVKSAARQVLTLYGQGFAFTADEAAEKLGKHVLGVRPRVSKLKTHGYLEIMRDDSGKKIRRSNDSGKQAMVHIISEKGMDTIRQVSGNA